MKVLLVTNIPNPYRVPLFNVLNKKLEHLNITLKVAFASSGYKGKLHKLSTKEFQFDWVYLTKYYLLEILFNRSNFFAYGSLLRLIVKEKPDKIIVAGFSIATLKIWIASFFINFEFFIWSGTVIHPYVKQSKLNTYYRKFLASRAKGFIAYSTLAKEYLMKMGISESEIVVAYNTVDTSHFELETKRIRETAIKARPFTLTFTGYLIKRKKVEQIVSVANELAKRIDSFKINLVGDGPEKESLQKMVSELNLSSYINFLGFKQKEELPAIYASTDIFLFQTDFDIWGLVLNEAMAAGLPCLASINGGASHDLIENDMTGFLVDYNKPDEVVDRILYLYNNSTKMEEISKNAVNLIKRKATLDNLSTSILTAIRL
jgi:glycosyltransferase involved in cell wall biosynthesis